MPEFNEWFPTSLHGTSALNVKDFGAIGDGGTHSMSDLGYANLAAAQVDYPSATHVDDTADWCAFTECVKHCFSHETSPGVWVVNGTESDRNRPMRVAPGRYVTRKPVALTSISDGQVIGEGFAQIFNETTGSIAVDGNGLQNTRFENLHFQCIGGEDSMAFNLGVVSGPVNSTGCLFINCSFTCPGGVGTRIGYVEMSSEMSFIRCIWNLCLCGVTIDGWNALNYNFTACTATFCTLNWIRVNSGGNVVIQNASLAGNGTDLVPEVGYDIKIGAGTCAIFGSRTESKRFVAADYMVSIFGCAQAGTAADIVFCNVGSAFISQSESTMGRLTSQGQLTMEGCRFNLSDDFLTAIANNGSGLIRITHAGGLPAPDEFFLDGDEVEITGVTSANTTAAGGAAHTNGVWIATRIDATHVDLQGSSFVADTYNYSVARIGPGPRYHLRDVLDPGKIPTRVQIAPTPRRDVVETKRRNSGLLWADSGKTFDNFNATGAVVFTLPDLSGGNFRGVTYRFVVLTAQTLTIQVYNWWGGSAPSGATQWSRIFRAGGYATAGMTISSNVVGNAVELYLADGDSNDPVNFDYVNNYNPSAWRWVVIAESGTWTIAGTPTATSVERDLETVT